MAERGRLLVVSHACVLAVNRPVYSRLRALGWDVTLVVPSRWRHEYAAAMFPPDPDGEGLNMRPLPVLLPGRPQRHLYRARVSRLLREVRPDVVFLEEETFSVPAMQWGRASAGCGVPFGLQAAENLERPLPFVARAIERALLARARFVAARSPAAMRRVRAHGARLVAVAPHGVPAWERSRAERNGTFTIGFAGRLVPEKGIDDLLAAARGVEGSRLVLVGDGPLRPVAEREGATVRIGIRHEEMPGEYASMDVLVLPSRSTPGWTEQFGRVLVEALWCGVPVVGSDSGEIPWVIDATGGGVVVPERDPDALAAALRQLRDDPAFRTTLAERGRAGVESAFSVDAAARALDDLLVEARS